MSKFEKTEPSPTFRMLQRLVVVLAALAVMGIVYWALHGRFQATNELSRRSTLNESPVSPAPAQR